MKSTNLANRSILITGGTGGVGRAVARAVDELGAEVIIGSRDLARYEQAAAELSSGRTRPFVADLTDSADVERGLERLVREGGLPTDVVHCAAGGMEAIMRDLVRLTSGLRRIDAAELDRAHSAAMLEMTDLVKGTRQAAMDVNCIGPANLLKRLVPMLPVGGVVIYFSSLWATHFPHPQVPMYYSAVAEAKQALEHWLEQEAQGWKARRITTAVISANLILDTRMGYLLDRMCTDLMLPSDRDRWRSTYVTNADMVRTALDVLTSRDSQAGFTRLFLPLPGQVLERMSPSDPPMQHAIAFAPNAPRWSAPGPD
jgi:NAD(P)-dependent dehydrogenase (short-subunit alcohol dehydrogenase family)